MRTHVPPLPGSSMNRDFLSVMFGAAWPRATVVSVPTLDTESWPAQPASHGLPQDPKCNNYFCVSLMRDPTSRKKTQFEALAVLVLDDVGPKGDPAQVLAAMGRPAYRVETSPGNQQWGYRLDPPITDRNRAERLPRRVVKHLYGGKDPGMLSITRLGRMPEGTNTKKHLGPDGHQTVFMWDTRSPPLDPAVIEAAMPLPGDAQMLSGAACPGVPDTDTDTDVDMLDPVAAPAPGSSTPRARDPVLTALRRLGYIQTGSRVSGSGLGWDIRCPWHHEHTPGTGAKDTGTFYFRGGGFKCWHGHCETKGPTDVRRRVDELLREDSGGLVGLDDLDPSKLTAIDPASVPASPVPPEPEAVREFWGDTVYHATADRFLSLRDYAAYYVDKAFDTVWFSRLRDDLPTSAKGAQVMPSQLYRGGERKKIVSGQTWWPGNPRLFTDQTHDQRTPVLNTWITPHRSLEKSQMPAANFNLVANTTNAIGDWITLQTILFQTHTPEGAANLEHWLDYLSLTVARVDIKPGHNPLFIGPQGVGKDIILQPILNVLGPTRYRHIDQDILKKGFTDWIMNRIVILPEVYRPSRWDVKGREEYTRIKSFCDPGKPFLSVNPKNRGVINVSNVFVLIMTSNEEIPLMLPADDRRIWVTRFEPTGWPVSRYQRLARSFKEPSPWGATNSDAIVEMLIRRYESRSAAEQQAMIARFTGHAPMTRDKAALIQRSRGDLEVWIEELLACKLPDPLTVPDVFTAQDILERAENAASMGGYGLARGTLPGNVTSIGRILRKLNCAPLNQGQGVPMPDGTERRVWARPGDTLYTAMSEAELRAWLDANRRP